MSHFYTRPRSVKNIAFEASFSHVVGAGPRRIHPKTPSGQLQKRCTFTFQFVYPACAASDRPIRFGIPALCNSRIVTISPSKRSRKVPLSLCNARSGHGKFVFTLAFVVVIVCHYLASMSAAWWSLCLEGIWVMVLSDVVFRG
jgi:hypothetical protein